MSLSRRTVMMGAFSLVCATPALAEDTLEFSELYTTGVELTDKAKRLSGSDILMHGFMAPPLKVDVSFFVLTRTPMAVCPFCDSTMQWPDDIVLVTVNEPITFTPFNVRIAVRGKLETGFVKDDATGFVSFVRLSQASYGSV